MTVNFEIEREPPPVVLGVVTLLKRSAADPARRKRLERMSGVVGLKSVKDPQAATVRFGKGRLAVSSGVAEDVGVTITLDFDDATVKPKVSRAARHPVFALNLAKVLEPPKRAWQEEAEAFWTFAAQAPRMPQGLRVVCTDDGAELTLGQGGPDVYEIHGSADALRSVFSGASVLGQDMFEGRLFVVGSTQHASILTGRSIAWAMGEGR